MFALCIYHLILSGIGSATASAIACAISGIIPLWYLGSEDKGTTDLSDIAVTPGEASPTDSRGNSLNFRELINDDEESIPFQEFLQKEFSLENLLVRISSSLNHAVHKSCAQIQGD